MFVNHILTADIDECASSPCIFGYCAEYSRDQGYMCICDIGYTSVHCDGMSLIGVKCSFRSFCGINKIY